MFSGRLLIKGCKGSDLSLLYSFNDFVPNRETKDGLQDRLQKYCILSEKEGEKRKSL